jgi:hypothetical protein
MDSSLFRIIFLLISLVSVAFADDFINDCLPFERKDIIQQISNYRLRIEPFYEKYGCDAVKIFNSLLKFEPEKAYIVFDEFEEKEDIFRTFLDIERHSKSVVFNNEILFQLILSDSFDVEDYKKLARLLRRLYYEKIRITEQNIGYVLMAVLLSKNGSDSYSIYKKLVNNVPYRVILYFWEFYSTLKEKVISYSVDHLIFGFGYLEQHLKPNIKKEVTKYIESIYLLPALYEDIPYENKRFYSKEYQKFAVSLFNEMIKCGYSVRDSLAFIKYNYNLIIKNLNEKRVLFNVYSAILKNGIFANFLLHSEGDFCTSIQNNIEKSLGNGNLERLINFYKHERQLFKELADEKSRLPFEYFLYVSNSYNSLPDEEWKVFKNLVKNLSPVPLYNIAVVIELQEDFRIDGNRYTKYILTQRDYDSIIEHNYDVEKGFSAPKYLYILVTSYPSQESNSVFERILCYTFKPGNCNTEEIVSAIQELSQKTPDELTEHRFTTLEKVFHYLDYADYLKDGVVAVAGCIATACTGSFAYFTVKNIAKEAAKKGLKAAIKKVELKIAKGINKVQRLRRLYKKRLEKGFGKERVDKLRKNIKAIDKIDKYDDLIISSGLALEGGLTLYYSLKSFEVRSICDAQEE